MWGTHNHFVTNNWRVIAVLDMIYGQTDPQKKTILLMVLGCIFHIYIIYTQFLLYKNILYKIPEFRGGSNS
jgi:hypothetical protein